MASKKPIELGGYGCEAIVDWRYARLRTQTDDGREVRLEIHTPYELAHVRKQLNKIEAYWREVLARGTPTGQGA